MKKKESDTVETTTFAIPTGNIVALLELAASDTPLEEPQFPKIGKGTTERAIIESKTIRRLATLAAAIDKHMIALRDAHEKLHQCDATAPHETDCDEYNAALGVMELRYEIMIGLLWQSIHEEFPQSLNCSMAIHEGWILASFDGDDWPSEPVSEKQRALVGSMIPRLMAIFRGEKVELLEHPIIGELEEDDTLIGEIDDVRLRSLLPFGNVLRQEFCDALVPIEMKTTLAAKPSIETVTECLEDLRISEAKAMANAAKRNKDRLGLPAKLFWRCVRDTVPGAADVDSIELRAGWKLVKSPPNPLITILEKLAANKEPSEADVHMLMRAVLTAQ